MRNLSACGQHAARELHLGRAQHNKSFQRQLVSGTSGGKLVASQKRKPRPKPINATSVTLSARVQQRIKRNKMCLAFANFGIFFLQRLISGMTRNLTAGEKRLRVEERVWEQGEGVSSAQWHNDAATHCT